MPRGAHSVLEDVREDLRSYQPLVSALPEADAIYDGHPADDRDYDASITLTVVSDVGTNHRGVSEKTYRIQATVTVRQDWREWYDSRSDERSSVAQMQYLLSLVDDRLGRGEATSPEIGTGSIGGPMPQELDDGRLAVSEDWRVTGYYPDD